MSYMNEEKSQSSNIYQLQNCKDGDFKNKYFIKTERSRITFLDPINQDIIHDFIYPSTQYRCKCCIEFCYQIKYVGETLNLVPDGSGKLTLPSIENFERNSDYTYEGKFKNGMFHGKGKITFNNSDTFEGIFDNNIISGPGTYTFHSISHKIVGIFDANMRINGEGSIIWNGKDKYEGMWENNILTANKYKYNAAAQYTSNYKSLEFAEFPRVISPCLYSLKSVGNGLEGGTVIDQYFSIYSGTFFNKHMHGQCDVKCRSYDHKKDILMKRGMFNDGQQISGYSRDVLGNTTIFEGQQNMPMFPMNGNYLYRSFANVLYEATYVNNTKEGPCKITFANGDLLTGICHNDVLEGEGIMLYSNKNKYIGNWSQSCQNGYGEMTYSNGDLYQGMWVNNMREGNGHLTTQNYIYIGGFVKDKRQGEGEEMSAAYYCKGTWNEDHKEGECTMSTSDGTCYIGSYHNNEKNDQGKQYESNGDFYEGHWKKNFKNGEGVMKYANGDIYNGFWKDDQRFGEGTMTFANGDIYSGQWMNDCRHGKGVMKYINGNVYDGMWHNNEMDGKGKMTYVNGNIYEGQWSMSTQNGSGISTYSDQSKYEGSWKNGTITGYGTYTDSFGISFTGSFLNNMKNSAFDISFPNLSETVRFVYNNDSFLICQNYYKNNDEYVTYEYDNSDLSIPLKVVSCSICCNNPIQQPQNSMSNDIVSYQGSIMNNMRNGQGSATFANGDRYYGLWKDDMFDGKGEYNFSNGDSFVGLFSKNRYINGTYTSKQFIYKGQYNELYQKQGQGTILYPMNYNVSSAECISYTGNFNNDLYDGNGEFKIPNNVSIKGTFKNGHVESINEDTYILFADGSEFRGRISEGNRNGKGTFISKSPNPYTYEGIYKNNMKEGQFIYSIFGCKYQITYINDQERKVQILSKPPPKPVPKANKNTTNDNHSNSKKTKKNGKKSKTEKQHQKQSSESHTINDNNMNQDNNNNDANTGSAFYPVTGIFNAGIKLFNNLRGKTN